MARNDLDRCPALALAAAGLVIVGAALITFPRRRRKPVRPPGPPRPKDSPMSLSDDDTDGISAIISDQYEGIWQPDDPTWAKSATTTASVALNEIHYEDQDSGQTDDTLARSAWTVDVVTSQGEFSMRGDIAQGALITVQAQPSTGFFYVVSNKQLTFYRTQSRNKPEHFESMTLNLKNQQKEYQCSGNGCGLGFSTQTKLP